MKWPKPGLLILPLILAALIAVFVANWWRHRQETPLDAAFAVLKGGYTAEALATVRRFARDGHRVARLVLAETYARGLGIPVDPVQASIWYRRVECDCQITGALEYHLALTYLEGQYGPSKKPEALPWLQRAADAGNENAQRLLGEREVLLSKGITVPDDVSGYWRRILSEK